MNVGLTLGVAPDTWSPELREASDEGEVKIVPYDITIGYDLWSYRKMK